MVFRRDTACIPLSAVHPVSAGPGNTQDTPWRQVPSHYAAPPGIVQVLPKSDKLFLSALDSERYRIQFVRVNGGRFGPGFRLRNALDFFDFLALWNGLSCFDCGLALVLAPFLFGQLAVQLHSTGKVMVFPVSVQQRRFKGRPKAPNGVHAVCTHGDCLGDFGLGVLYGKGSVAPFIVADLVKVQELRHVAYVVVEELLQRGKLFLAALLVKFVDLP